MRKSSCFKVNDRAMVTVTRNGFFKGEIVVITDPDKTKDGKEYFIEVRSINKTGLITKKYLKRLK